MGLFDRLKQAKNFLSGGSAKLSLRFAKPYYVKGEIINLLITCQVKDADVFANNIYLMVNAIETVNLKIPASGSQKKPAHSQEYTKTERHYSYKMNVEVAPSQVLQAGEYYEWEASFELPDDVLLTYIGENASHRWKVQAGVDTSGNDPDTGWQEFTLYGNMPPAN